MNRVPIDGSAYLVPQFDSSSINDMGDEDEEFGFGERYWFECAMVSACDPIMNSCEDNHEVEERLTKAGVISEVDGTDSESCAVVVRFKTQAQGIAFIVRLNTYLIKKARKLSEAENY